MILVIGATGNIGRPLVHELLDRGAPVRALTRSPDTADLPPRAEIVRGDLDDPDSLAAAFDGVARVFLVTRVSRLVAHTRAVLAAAGSVRHLVLLSSMGAQADLGDAIGDWNREAEELVRGSGLEWTFLRAGAFTTNALQWAETVRTEGVAHTMFGEVPTAPVDPRDLALAAATVLTGTGHSGRCYPITGPQRLTPAEQVAELSRLLGRELHTEPLPESVVQQAFGWFGSPEKVRRTVEVLGSPDVPWAFPGPELATLTGATPRTFADWARDNIAAFR